MGKDYGSWSLTDLKNELRKRNAKISGKKADLVKRLEDYDKLFGQLVNEPETVFKITVPNPENFRDVTSDFAMPVLTEDALETFSQLSEREDLITSKNMYEEKFLMSCRTAYQDGDYFCIGQCASEMRKNISYNITIKAKDNLILEAQCECAAGAGPYGQCKHILVAIYAIIDFNKTKTIKLKESCTSRLQTFHQPTKQYTGNPIKAEHLTLKFKNEKMKLMTIFDPRSNTENVLKYRENFKNLIVNSTHENPNMPIAQLVLPADKRSAYSEHDYLKKTAEEEYWNSIRLNETQIIDLENRTKTNKKEWLKERKVRLQSSDFGKICKQKTNKMKLAKSIIKGNNLQTPAIKHGRKYEPEAIKKFEELTGSPITKCGIIVHPENQFLGSTPDALVGENEVLEVKCPYGAKNENISVENVPYLYLCDETGTLKLKESHDYYYQIQGQMYCSQRNMANFLIYTLTNHYLIKIQRDENFITAMIQELKSFYIDYYKQVLLDRFLYNKRF